MNRLRRKTCSQRWLPFAPRLSPSTSVTICFSLQLSHAPPLAFFDFVSAATRLGFKRVDKPGQLSMRRPFEALSDTTIVHFLDANEIPAELSDLRLLRYVTRHTSHVICIRLHARMCHQCGVSKAVQLFQRPRAADEGPAAAFHVRSEGCTRFLWIPQLERCRPSLPPPSPLPPSSAFPPQRRSLFRPHSHAPLQAS